MSQILGSLIGSSFEPTQQTTQSMATTTSFEPSPALFSRTRLFARYPLLFYFVFAYGSTWLIWSYYLLSQEGTGLLNYHCELDYMTVIAAGTFGPALAALLMAGVTEGREGLRAVLQSCVRLRVGLRWYVFALLGIPIILTLGSMAVPSIWTSRIAPDLAQVLPEYLVFFVYPALLIGGPLGEEPGWRGFALPRLQQKYGPLVGSLVLGLLWVGWHVPIWFGGQWTELTVENVLLYSVFMTSMTVIMSWVWNRTHGNIWMAILMHTSLDAFPNAILWPAMPAAAEMSEGNYLNGYLGLALGLGTAAVWLVVATRKQLGLSVPLHLRPPT